MSIFSSTVKLHVEDLGNNAPALVSLHYWGVRRALGGMSCSALGLPFAPLQSISEMSVPLAVRQDMVKAYDSRECILATVRQVLAADPLQPDDLETVVQDSLQGVPAAKVAWPLAASQEDIGAQAARICVPTLVISGEEIRSPPCSAAEGADDAHIARQVAYPAGHRPPLAPGSTGRPV